MYVLTLATILAGCGRNASEKSAATTPPGAAEIVGSVILKGDAPTLPPVDVSAVRECASRHPNGLADDSIVVSSDGKLANVLVYLKGPYWPDGSGSEPALLDQVGCRYVPHVIGIQTGQKLRIQSSDPFLHNVHGLADRNAAFNFAEPGLGAKDLDGWTQPEIFAVKCDVHPWMKAWVGVFDHPWFTVTGPDGAFRLAKAPPGNYTLVAWHERFGQLTRDIKIPASGTVDVQFEYAK